MDQAGARGFRGERVTGGECILEGGAIVDVQAGGMVRQYPEAIDLCKKCSERFADWLRSGGQANHSGPGGAISQTAVLLVMV